MVEPWIALSAAETVVLPAATPVVTPLVPIVAKPEGDVLHKTDVVTSCVVLLLYVPTALNGRVIPGARLEFAGLTVIDCNVGLHMPAL